MKEKEKKNGKKCRGRKEKGYMKEQRERDKEMIERDKEGKTNREIKEQKETNDKKREEMTSIIKENNEE
jgi:hypothetical protein